MILGNMMSDVLRRVSDSYESSTECVSTEMMCRGIKEANSRIRLQEVDPNQVVIGSMDAVRYTLV